MARKPKLHKKIKELTPAESLAQVKALLKRKRPMKSNELKPGHLIFSAYNAKDKTQTYDRTPLVLILRRNKTHTLGLNFHWIPFSMRINLVKHIMQMNAANIRQRKPLQFSYKDLKPMLRSLGYAPCIRLYINRRFGKQGVIIPNYQLMDMARLRTETFTKGRFTASEMFQMAKSKGKSKNGYKRKKQNK